MNHYLIIRREGFSLALYSFSILFFIGLAGGCTSSMSEIPTPIVKVPAQEQEVLLAQQEQGALTGVNNARGVLNASAKMDNCEGGVKTDCTRAIESIMGVSNTGDRVGVTFGRCVHGQDYKLSSSGAGGQKVIRCSKGPQQQPGEPVTPEQIEAANGEQQEATPEQPNDTANN